MADHISTTSISSAERESLAYQTLLGLHKVGIRYCLWKSFDRLEEGVKGETDFDILMDKAQEDVVIKHLSSNGWFQVHSEPWRRFPDVYDFFKFDSQYGKFLHMHVHFKLVMGEKMVKSLCLPLESLYLETAVDAGGIYHALPELELTVFILRLTLKICWIDYARIIRRRDRKMIYRDLMPEFQHIRERCDRTRLKNLLDHPSLSFIDKSLILDSYDDIYSLTYRRRHLVLRQIAPYRRYGKLARVLVHFFRCYQQRSFGVGKVFPGKGLSFTFCGPDGSGKTTLADAIEKNLTEQFKVARYYMGGNQNSRGVERWAAFLILTGPYLIIRKFFKIINFQSAVKMMERLYFGFEYYLIALEKYQHYNNGEIELKRGAFVLYERFPLFPKGGDRGQRDDKTFFKESEQKLYDQIKPPDIIFVLRVDVEEAIRRKPDHHPNEIRTKTSEFKKYIEENQNNPQVMVLDASAPINSILESSLARMSLELNRDS
jgi:thymidylate kinase